MLVRRTELLAAGHTEAEIRRRVDRGELHRIAAGVYVRETDWRTTDADDRLAVRAMAEAAVSPELVISHLSAAVVYQLPVVLADTSRVHLTRPGGGGHRLTARRVVHAGLLGDDDIVVADRTRLTCPARTLVDLALTESAATAVAAADAALHRELVTPDQVVAALDAHPARRGRPRAVRVLRQVDGRSESPGESRLRLSLAGASLPTALDLQVWILNERGTRLARVDGALLDAGVLLEFDGRIKYGKLLGENPTPEQVSAAVAREKAREDRLRELGWLVVRITWDELRDPVALRRRIQEACAARRRWTTPVRGTYELIPPLTISC